VDGDAGDTDAADESVGDFAGSAFDTGGGASVVVVMVVLYGEEWLDNTWSAAIASAMPRDCG
jgi:hypothetical protein